MRRLLRRCLERNPKNRLHDIADARIVLEELASGRSDERDSRSPGAPAGEAVPARSRWSLAAAALATGLVLGGVLAWTLARSTLEPPAPPRATRFAIYPPEGSSFQRSVAISPDGERIAFSALRADGQSTLWVRPLDALEAYELPGTEGARLPFWAPDGRRLGFFASRGLYWTDSKGGSPIFVVETANSQDVRGASWSADDTIVYGPSITGPLFAVPAKGGKSVPATRISDGGAIGTNRFPRFLPDGRRFVYYAAAGAGTEPGELWLGRLGSLVGKLLGPASSMAVPAPPGFLLYARGETLVAQRFDDEREELVGAPEILGLPMGGSLGVSGLRSIATSTDGTLLYRNDKRNASQLVLAGRDGREIDALSDATSAWNYAPQLSPDGKFLLCSRFVFPAAGLGQIWALDLNRKLASRITFQDDADQFISLWMPPGSREFLFNSVRPGGRWSILHGSIDRPRETSVWLEDDKLIAAKAVTPDGRRVVYERDEGYGQIQLWLRDLDGTGPGTRLTAESAIESNPDVSPDGRWLAYASSATREWEVYVRPLDGGSEVRISNGGGVSPRWRRDGRELFYVDASGRLVAVPIAPPQAGGDTVEPGAPEILFLARLEESSDRQYDVLPDGQRFVLNQIVASDDVPIVVVQQWTSLLEKGAP
jgi:eukaryotic-like serine/threonine-protein kinase